MDGNSLECRRDICIWPPSTARIKFDAEDRIFFGRLAGIRDIITFHGETVDELEIAFKEIDAYYGMRGSAVSQSSRRFKKDIYRDTKRKKMLANIERNIHIV